MLGLALGLGGIAYGWIIGSAALMILGWFALLLTMATLLQRDWQRYDEIVNHPLSDREER
jgi:hypothetical protein